MLTRPLSFAPEDIHIDSIDVVFTDLTSYLELCQGPFPLYIMSYRPIAESNSFKEIVNRPVNSDEDKFNRKIREIRDGMDDKSQ